MLKSIKLILIAILSSIGFSCAPSSDSPTTERVAIECSQSSLLGTHTLNYALLVKTEFPSQFTASEVTFNSNCEFSEVLNTDEYLTGSFKDFANESKVELKINDKVYSFDYVFYNNEIVFTNKALK